MKRSNSRTKYVLGGFVLAAIVATTTACGGDDLYDPGMQPDTVHAVTHARGTTDVPTDPQRVVVLEPVQLDTSVALGVIPVGTAVLSETTGVPAYLGEKAAEIEMVGTVAAPNLEKIVALNLLAPFTVAQAANTVMQQQSDGGAIVNIGSVSAHDPQPGTAAYSAAKAGLLVLTKALALEWAPKARINHITTGLIRTESAASVYGDDGGAAVTRTLPMGRMAVPSDIADACLFLASAQASYVNGADLAVHGGGEYPARYLATHS